MATKTISVSTHTDDYNAGANLPASQRVGIRLVDGKYTFKSDTKRSGVLDVTDLVERVENEDGSETLTINLVSLLKESGVKTKTAGRPKGTTKTEDAEDDAEDAEEEEDAEDAS